jgi:hypothetical protein
MPATSASFALFASSQSGSTQDLAPAALLRSEFDRLAVDETVVSPSLQKLFVEDREQVLAAALARLERLSKLPESKRPTPERTARIEVDQWVEKTLVDLAYARYVKFMLDIGVEKSKLVGRARFSFYGESRRTIYYNFLEIERRGLRPGTKFIYERNIYTVKTITHDAFIVRLEKGCQGSLSPSNCEVIDDPENEGSEST